MKVLNLYAGIGGNRKLWPKECEVTAVELNPEIARIYQDFFPNDKVVMADAHNFLLNNYKEFDFIWSSPPCPTHGVSRYWATKGKRAERQPNYPNPIYPSMKLYEEIIFLKHFVKCKWVVENVISYYNPLIKPFVYGSHYYWSNFLIQESSKKVFRNHLGLVTDLEKLKGFDLNKYKGINKTKTLRNCVEPEAGLYVFECAFKVKQEALLKW